MQITNSVRQGAQSHGHSSTQSLLLVDLESGTEEVKGYDEQYEVGLKRSPDAVLSQIQGAAACELQHSSLGCAVRHKARLRHKRTGGGNVYDRPCTHRSPSSSSLYL